LSTPAPKHENAPETLPPPATPESIVRDAFDDVAIVIGGAAASYQLEDDLLWTLMSRLDRIRVRTLHRLTAGGPIAATAAVPRLHPAVDQFLARNAAGEARA
jgi:hypothetical protein